MHDSARPPTATFSLQSRRFTQSRAPPPVQPCSTINDHNHAPSRIRCSRSRRVSSITSQPAGGRFLEVRTLGMVVWRVVAKSAKCEKKQAVNAQRHQPCPPKRLERGRKPHLPAASSTADSGRSQPQAAAMSRRIAPAKMPTPGPAGSGEGESWEGDQESVAWQGGEGTTDPYAEAMDLTGLPGADLLEDSGPVLVDGLPVGSLSTRRTYMAIAEDILDLKAGVTGGE